MTPIFDDTNLGGPSFNIFLHDVQNQTIWSTQEPHFQHLLREREAPVVDELLAPLRDGRLDKLHFMGGVNHIERMDFTVVAGGGWGSALPKQQSVQQHIASRGNYEWLWEHG